MQVQVNTSNGIDNNDGLERWASDQINTRLARFAQDITSVEVQLSSEHHATSEGGADRRCMLEARVKGIAPVAVSHHAESQDLAFRGAIDKLSHALEHAFGKQDRQNHRQRESIRKDAETLAAQDAE